MEHLPIHRRDAHQAVAVLAVAPRIPTSIWILQMISRMILVSPFGSNCSEDEKSDPSPPPKQPLHIKNLAIARTAWVALSRLPTGSLWEAGYT